MITNITCIKETNPSNLTKHIKQAAGIVFLLAGVCLSRIQAGTVAGVVNLDETTMASWEKIRPSGAEWTVKNGTWQGKASPDQWWRMLVGGKSDATDYTVEVYLKIIKPNSTTPFYCGPSFCNYWNGATDGGYDTAVVARYTGDDYYRVQLSIKYQEVVLFKKSGGFVQVKSCALEPGKLYHLKVEVSGQRLRVWVDPVPKSGETGKPRGTLIEYWDRIQPISKGCFGVGFYNSEIEIEKIILAEAVQCDVVPERPSSCFTVRPWRDMKYWIFDHDEPIAHFDEKTLVMWNAKLVSGYAPMGYWELHWKQYDGMHNYANHLDNLQVDKQGGSTLCMHWTAHNEVPPDKFVKLYPELKGKPYADKNVRIITNLVKLNLTHDTALASYIYAVDNEFSVDPERYWKDTADGLEYCNLIPYNVVGPAVAMPEPWPWAYKWVLIRGSDGKVCRHPIHHNGVPRVYPKPDGGFYTYALGEVLNPTTEFSNPVDPMLKPYAGLCHWAYDIHFRYLPYKSQEIIPSGTRHKASYRVLNYDIARVKKIMDESEILPEFKTDSEYAIFVPGINDFKKGRRFSEPHAEWAWSGGTWDKTVGHGDTFSICLKLDKLNTMRCECTSGSSYFMKGYESGVYECSAWVKTKDVTGKGATIRVWTNDGKNESVSYCSQRIIGTSDWTRLVFRPDNVGASKYHVKIGLELEGTGTAWFDDVVLERK